MNEQITAPLLIIWSFSNLVMFCAWVFQHKTKRAEIVDICWTLLLGASGAFVAASSDGDLTRRLILGVVILVWSARLGVHLIKDRLLASSEDPRYADLRSEWGEKSTANFFIFFMLQAFLVPVFSTAYLAVANNSSSIGDLDFVAIIVVVVALLGEGIADKQLLQFKKQRKDKKSVCNVGLWSWSRHPNYFFEWLHWLSYPLLAANGSYWWLSLVSPIFMYYLIRNVTGVKPLEARMRTHYRESFLDYEKRVSEFFPRPPKNQI